MSGVRFPLRLNPENPEQAAVIDILRGVPNGEKSRYIVRAVLAYEGGARQEERLRALLREELAKAIPATPAMTAPPTKPSSEIPPEMLDFLTALDEEAEAHD